MQQDANFAALLLFADGENRKGPDSFGPFMQHLMPAGTAVFRCGDLWASSIFQLQLIRAWEGVALPINLAVLLYAVSPALITTLLYAAFSALMTALLYAAFSALMTALLYAAFSALM